VISRPNTSKKAGKKAGRPASQELHALAAHRLFPMFTALWCAALFGLGSLAISASALAWLVVMTGLPAIIPAAAPPLGFTARMALALFMALAGGAAGMMIGMAIQRRAPAREPAQTNTPPLRRTAGATAAAGPVSAPSSALPFTMPSAPLPAQEQPVSTAAPKVRARDAHPDAPPRRPLELTDDLAADPIPGGPVADDLPISPAPQMADADPPTRFPARVAAVSSDEAAAVDVPLAQEPILLSELAPPDLAEPDAPDASPSPAPLQEAAIDAARAAGLLDGDRLTGKLLTELPLDSLGMLQLIERLALALDARRSNRQSAPAGEAMAAPPARFARPLAGSPIAPTGAARENALADPGAIPEVPGSEAPGPSLVPPLSDLTARYASLVAAVPAAEGGDARTAADPVLAFPGEAARLGLAAMRQQARAAPAAKAPVPMPRPQFTSAEDADAALRAALATLKRMAAQS